MAARHRSSLLSDLFFTIMTMESVKARPPASSLATPVLADGYPQALDALHRRVSPGELVRSPAGYVLASLAAVPDAPAGPLSRFGVAVTRTQPGPAVGGGPAAAVAGQFAHGLLNLHQELLENVLRQVMRHLEGRTSGGTTLASKDLIRGQLADIGIRLSEAREIIARPRESGSQAGWRLHLRQVAAGRLLLLLLGASGFLADGPGGDLHLAEVAGNVYLHPDDADA
jgi:hypothetical protein